MDRSSPAEGASPPQQRSRLPSEDSVPPRAASDERLRKRPRLGTPDQAMSAGKLSGNDGATASSRPTTPALRSSAISIPSDSSDPPSDQGDLDLRPTESAENASPSVASPTTTRLVLPTHAPTSNAKSNHLQQTPPPSDLKESPEHSPVIEIEVDEIDDADNGQYSRMLDLASSDSYGPELIDDFPMANDMTATGAVRYYGNYLSGAAEPMDPSYIVDLIDWFEQWLQYTSSRSAKWHTDYAVNKQFWYAIGGMFSKLLGRRVPFASTGPRSSPNIVFGNLRKLLCAYLELCGHLIDVDLHVASRAQEALDAGDLMSVRHVANLATVFFAEEDVPLWTMLRQKNRAQAESIHSTMVHDLLASDSYLKRSLVPFAKILATKFFLWTNIHELLLHLIKIQRSVTNFLVRNTQEDGELSPGVKAFALDVYAMVRTLEVELHDRLGKPTPALPVDYYKTLVAQLGCLLLHLVSIDNDICQSAIRTEFADNKENLGSDPSQHPTFVHYSFVFKMWWRFVLRGKMELRVIGVASIETELESLSTGHLRHTSQSLMRILAQLLVDKQAMEYLVGVESHPQLVSRSVGIASFMNRTGSWSDRLTDRVWSTLSTSSNPHMISATFDMLHRTMFTFAGQDCLYFLQKINGLPFLNFNCAMMQFAWQLAESLKKYEEMFEDSRTGIFAFFVRLLRQSFAIENYNAPSRAIMRNVSREIYASLVKHTMRQADRTLIYEDCVAQIVGHKDDVSGSIVAISVMVEECWTEDSVFLLDRLNLLHILCEEICRFISVQDRNSIDRDGLHCRYFLFMHLMSNTNSAVLPLELEQRLWSHMVGRDACDDTARDEAFDLLSSIGTKSNTKHPFIDRCISTHLEQLDPAYFTRGLFRFIDAAMQYTQAVSPPASPGENNVVQIPLVDVVWRIVLNAADNTVESAATRLLSQYYLDSNFIKRASRSSVDATYTAAVDHCVGQLKTSALALSQTHEMMDIEQSPGVYEIQQRSFIRTLGFMKRFLGDVKARPESGTPSKVNSDVNVQCTTYNGEPIVIKYQAHGPGVDTKIRELTIGGSSTCAELSAMLRTATGINRMSVIAGGQKINLDRDSNSLVKSVAGKGLFLVRDVGDKEEQLKRASATIPKSAVEQAVLAHMDDLYGFLDLETRLSHHVYEFLSHFPPHMHPYEVVLSDGPDQLSRLFPSGKPSKTMYSITSLRRHLQIQLSSGVLNQSFITRSIQVFCDAIKGSPTRQSLLVDPPDCSCTQALLESLLYFLKECPRADASHSDVTGAPVLVDNIWTMLLDHKQRQIRQDLPPVGLAYSVVLELSMHDRGIWDAFSGQEDALDMHEYLLLTIDDESIQDQVRVCLENVCNGSVGELAIPQFDFINFYWSILPSLILKTPSSPSQSRCLLAAARTVFSARHAHDLPEQELRAYMSTWTRLLLEHKNTEVLGSEVVDQFLFGIVRMVALCVSFLKALKKPLEIPNLMRALFDQFLFPPTLHNTTSGGQDLLPILDSDTRREFYTLVMTLCEDESACSVLLDKTEDIIEEELRCAPLWAGTDRSRWLRTSAGYSGLRNLTNTCYMNSLLTQLFMNTRFRRLILEADIADGEGSQNLLSQTQTLFAEMQDNKQKFAETSFFAAAVRPYDGEQIDVAIQMDADEFFNLIFDRWEGQFLTPQSKQEFRSVFGGQIVTQIKSMDCKHVSERLEPFLAIQCDVKGKSNLLESLKAYVEGDVMEGDNKYKCESCGGKFVDAVKRSCLKDIPDNLIFHLKRFDFDLTTLQRSKIDDYFAFPITIDMQQYNVEYLNNPKDNDTPDQFELVGILVHSGTAETGHYYSYIRQTRDRVSSWLEFNDTEVNPFDPAKIADYCYGGPEFRGGEGKFNSAYMLFYRRVNSDASMRLNESATNVAVPPRLSKRITTDNNLLARRFALFSHEHAVFVRSLLAKIKSFHGGVCSPDHVLEEVGFGVVLAHLDSVLARVKDVPDIEPTVLAITRAVSNCGLCAAVVIEYFSVQSDKAQNLLIGNPMAKVRQAFVRLLFDALGVVRKLNTHDYGIEPSEDDSSLASSNEEIGSFWSVVNLLRGMIPQLAKSLRAWDEYFGLWVMIINLGTAEFSFVLEEKILRDCLEILMTSVKTNLPRRTHLLDIYRAVPRARKPPPYLGLVRLIVTFLRRMEPFSDPVPDDRRYPVSDTMPKRFFLTESEHMWFNAPSGSANSTNLHFLTRIFECCEQIETLDFPSQLIGGFLATDIDSLDVKRIAHALETNINEYHVPFVGPVLRATVVFARRCPDDKDMTQLAYNAAGSTRRLRPVYNVRRGSVDILGESDSGGAEAHLTFFEELASMQETKCAENGEQPHLVTVLQCAPLWASNLLVCDESEVRAKTFHLLEQLIFDHFPAYFSDTVGLTPLDTSRVKAVRDLSIRCFDHFNKAWQARLPRNTVQPLLATLTAITKWSVRLHESSVDALDSIISPDDQAGVVMRWAEINAKSADYGDGEVEDAFTEVDYASNFEDDSDETTDN